jgi:hypothetical protein
MSVVLAGIASTSFYMKKSAAATNHYIVQANNGNRMLDYVGRDLARAVRVGHVSGATNTALKAGTCGITETDMLTVNLPDFYTSNTPDNTAGAAYKTPRYSRESLGATGYVPWQNAVMAVGGMLVPRFAPATGSDEIQVRYYRAQRSPQDSSMCYFRREYSPSGVALSPAVEVAEMVSMGNSITSLIVTGLENGKLFRIQSNFTPGFRRGGATSAGTVQVREVRVQNARRD